MSVVATENASRTRYKMSVQEESLIKLTKNVPLLFTAWGNIDDLHVAYRLSHVRKTENLTTLQKHTCMYMYM